MGKSSALGVLIFWYWKYILLPPTATRVGAFTRGRRLYRREKRFLRVHLDPQALLKGIRSQDLRCESKRLATFNTFDWLLDGMLPHCHQYVVRDGDKDNNGDNVDCDNSTCLFEQDLPASCTWGFTVDGFREIRSEDKKHQTPKPQGQSSVSPSSYSLDLGK